MPEDDDFLKDLKLSIESIEGFNHDRPLSSFEESLEIIRSAGFKPIAVTQMMFEDTFVFETDEEATKAYTLLEIGGEVCGWWYGREEFLEEVRDYEKGGVKVLIYWL